MGNKLYYKYIMCAVPFTFVNNLLQRAKNLTLLTLGGVVPYASNHKRLSSVFYTCQLSDIFAYETLTEAAQSHKLATAGSPGWGGSVQSIIGRTIVPIVVYNFHSFLSQDRFFLFAARAASSTKSMVTRIMNTVESISELFMSANWLEREAAELSGVLFNGKKDLRNLMLQFGDLTVPFRKAFPAVGLRDICYDPVKDTITQVPTSVQA